MKISDIRKFVITLLVLASITFGFTGCNKEKALATVRQFDELAAKLLIYGRNIARANNESFRQGNISPEIHLATNKAVDAYLRGIDVYLAGVEAAKKAINAGASPSGQLDILEKLFDAEVVQAALALINQVANVPPALADKVGGWAAAIQLGLSSFKALIASAHTALKAEVNHV